MFGLARLIRETFFAPAATAVAPRKIRRRSRLGDIVEAELRAARPTTRLKPARCAAVAAPFLHRRPKSLPSTGRERTRMPHRLAIA